MTKTEKMKRALREIEEIAREAIECDDPNLYCYDGMLLIERITRELTL